MHAYLIIAHDNVPLLRELVHCLDDSRNDIFIHWDKKSGELPDVSAENAGLFYTDRLDVRWGAFSVVEAEYVLFETAVKNGPYEYYHLISGVDLPIKSQNYIHEFCHENYGKEYIGFADASEKEIRYRTDHYFVFDDDFKGNGLVKRVIRKLFVKVQDLIHYRRTSPFDIKKGSQWCSITEPFVKYLLANHNLVRKCFRHTFCPDELFIQTLCFNSGFYSSAYNDYDEFEGNLRYIKWINGCLEDIDSSDYDFMISSDRLFARKFSSKDVEVINNVSTFVRLTE